MNNTAIVPQYIAYFSIARPLKHNKHFNDCKIPDNISYKKINRLKLDIDYEPIALKPDPF